MWRAWHVQHRYTRHDRLVEAKTTTDMNMNVIAVSQTPDVNRLMTKHAIKIYTERILTAS